MCAGSGLACTLELAYHIESTRLSLWISISALESLGQPTAFHFEGRGKDQPFPEPQKLSLSPSSWVLAQRTQVQSQCVFSTAAITY
jgi:hypothetical protein